MKKYSIWVLFIVMTINASAQKYALEKNSVIFYSEAAIENITAKNEKVTSVLNSATAEVAFSIPIREFQFAKKLMQEHFNEKYMETEKFPKSTFSGKITGFSMSTKGVQQVKANGKLTIHGVTTTIDVPGTAEVQSGKIILKSKFMVKLADYNIKIPQLMWQNIAEQVEVTVDFTYKPQ